MSDQEHPNFKPDSEQQLIEAVTWAISERKGLRLQGSNSKAGLGRPTEDATQATLSMAGFAKIQNYEAAELVMTTGAATPMAKIEAALAQNNQMLAFEPMDPAHILGLGTGEASGTIGGVFACNLSGPRRLSQGAARDHLLGFKAVSGRGEAFKSGGQVIKNVTGYDLSKLMAGSWGTLAAMHEISMKVVPKPETSRTLLVTGVDHVKATQIMTEALQTSYDVSGACWLPANLVKTSKVEVLQLCETSIVACRLEGPEPSVKTRVKSLRDMFANHGKIEELHKENSEAFWKEIKDVMPYAQADDQRVVWKISVAPSDGCKLIDSLQNLKDADFFMDWGGGLVWLAVESPKTGGESVIRNAVASLGGHATLFRGPDDLRKNIDVMPPQATAIAALNKRIKDQFDPLGILNPGRMYAAHQKRES